MKVLVLTSGGDAPGMNMVIAKLYKAFKQNIYACVAGFEGLINGNILPLEKFKPLEYQYEAGSIIKCSRYSEFKTKTGFEKGLKNAKLYDYVIILGGNGSQKGAMALAKEGVNTIFIPATIDNDVKRSEYSQGFDTAVQACCQVYKNVMPTMEAFNRCAIFEVMGRNSSAIAEEVQKRCNADILIKKFSELEVTEIASLAWENKKKGMASSVIIKEKIIDIDELCSNLTNISSGTEYKGVVVGYLQRGTKPTKKELKIARNFANLAITYIRLKAYGCGCVYVKDGECKLKMFTSLED